MTRACPTTLAQTLPAGAGDKADPDSVVLCLGSDKAFLSCSGRIPRSGKGDI